MQEHTPLSQPLMLRCLHFRARRGPDSPPCRPSCLPRICAWSCAASAAVRLRLSSVWRCETDVSPDVACCHAPSPHSTPPGFISARPPLSVSLSLRICSTSCSTIPWKRSCCFVRCVCHSCPLPATAPLSVPARGVGAGSQGRSSNGTSTAAWRKTMMPARPLRRWQQRLCRLCRLIVGEGLCTGCIMKTEAGCEK